MTIEVLISCMHQTDWSIIERSNVQTDVLIINQCDREEQEVYSFTNSRGEKCLARMICTTERGLSRSRNMALKNAQGDVCLFCDDDEVLVEGYDDIIRTACEQHEAYSLIAFRLTYSRKTFPEEVQTYNRFSSGRLSSAQIAFRRIEVLKTGVWFDEQIGSGTGNGGGEETKWLYQLLSKRAIRAIYLPKLIARINDGDSMWFKGYNKQYFVNYGWTIRRIYGTLLGAMFLCYHIVSHRQFYSPYCGIIDMCKYIARGFFEKRT